MDQVRIAVDLIETVMTIRQFSLFVIIGMMFYMVPYVKKFMTPTACDIDGSELLDYVYKEGLSATEK